MSKLWKWFENHMSPCIVCFSILSVIIFVIIVIVLQINGTTLSDAFIDNFFKFFGYEMLALSGIKISKHIGSAFGKTMDAIDGCYVENDYEEGEN